VRLHADRVDDRVRAAAVGQLADVVAEVLLVDLQVDDLDAARGDAGEAVGLEIDADDAEALVLGDAAGHVADRAEAEDDERAAVGHRRVLDGLPGGRQDVGEVDEPVVRRALGDLDRRVLRLRHAQELGLPAGHRAVELGVAEQRRALALSRTWVVSHCVYSSSLHMKQCPQDIWNGMTTRSPAWTLVMPEPTSSTMPIGSWPMMSPSVMKGPSTS
jgi:hypothetical protein